MMGNIYKFTVWIIISLIFFLFEKFVNLFVKHFLMHNILIQNHKYIHEKMLIESLTENRLCSEEDVRSRRGDEVDQKYFFEEKLAKKQLETNLQ